MRDDLLDAIDGGSKSIPGAAARAETPNSPNHPRFRMALMRRHGDMVRADGSSAANELISTSGHTGTHVDALAHVSYRATCMAAPPRTKPSRGTLSVPAWDTIEPLVCRGVLLDVAGLRGVDVLPVDTA